jgi:hypothetical protein
MTDYTSMPSEGGMVTATATTEMFYHPGVVRTPILTQSNFEWAVRSLALMLTSWQEPPHARGPQWITPPRVMGQNQ